MSLLGGNFVLVEVDGSFMLKEEKVSEDDMQETEDIKDECKEFEVGEDTLQPPPPDALEPQVLVDFKEEEVDDPLAATPGPSIEFVDVDSTYEAEEVPDWDAADSPENLVAQPNTAGTNESNETTNLTDFSAVASGPDEEAVYSKHYMAQPNTVGVSGINKSTSLLDFCTNASDPDDDESIYSNNSSDCEGDIESAPSTEGEDSHGERPSSVSSDEVDDKDVAAASSGNSPWTWTRAKNIVRQIPFTGEPGINPALQERLHVKSKELDYVSEILSTDFFEIIVNETNRHAAALLNCPGKRRMYDDDKWFPVTVDEMKIYLALIILMSQDRKPTIKLYWSRRKIIESRIFQETMPYKRFMLITRFMYFANDCAEDCDRLKKIRPIIEYMNRKFQYVYTPEKYLTIDESLMKRRDRFTYFEGNSRKRARVLLKFYKLYESKSGYCYKFSIQCGEEDHRNISATEAIALELSEEVQHQGYTVHLNSWYSSPMLCKRLLDLGTHAIGTVKPHRKNIPKECVNAKLRKGQHCWRSANNVLFVKWHDKQDVYLLSTKHSGVKMTHIGRKPGGRGHSQCSVVPKCILDYNSNMGGVGRQRQLLSSFPVMRRCTNSYRKVFFYMLDIALFNAFALKEKITNRKHSFSEFRLGLVEQILQAATLPTYIPRRTVSLEKNPLRLQARQWAHFPGHISPLVAGKRKQKHCAVCKAKKVRGETSYQCKKCQVPLHIPACFELYHTYTCY